MSANHLSGNWKMNKNPEEAKVTSAEAVASKLPSSDLLSW